MILGIRWQELRACIVKEMRLLRHDLHGLALLFIMPAAFILVMSLALEEQYSTRTGKKLEVTVIDRDQSAASQQFVARLRDTNAFDVSESSSPDDDKFILTIDRGFGTQLAGGETSQPAVTLDVAADVAQQTQAIVSAAVREALGRQSVDALVQAMRTMLQPLNASQGTETPAAKEPALRVRYDYLTGDAPPSAVQQNVPAWLVFAIFFVVIPVSNALIRERQLGTLRRLKTLRVSNATLLLGKLVPYFGVNMIQTGIMLAIGVFLVPRLGGDALVLNGSFGALLVIAAAVSIAALGYALLIAVIAKTTEQATVIGGAGNVILAAVGGIMVPKFIMPPVMQTVADYSPMAWGLEGFLDVLLRGGNVQSVIPEAGKLLLLGVFALVAAGILQARARE